MELVSSVVIPAHNEGETIEEVVRRSVDVLRASGGGEVIVVDDGSNDDTWDRLSRLDLPEVRVIRHRRNQGLSAALGAGFSAAQGRFLYFLCADMQCDPREALPRMRRALDDGAEIVFGYRKNRHEMKTLSSAGYRWLCRLLFGVGLRDMNWVKGFRREVLDAVILRPGWHRFLAVLAVSEGFRYAEVETEYYPRRHGASHFGIMRIPQSIGHMMALKFHISFAGQPLLLFGYIGALLLAISGFGVAYYLCQWLAYGEKYRQLLFPVFFFALTGVQFILMGFLAESIAHLLHVVTKKR